MPATDEIEEHIQKNKYYLSQKALRDVGRTEAVRDLLTDPEKMKVLVPYAYAYGNNGRQNYFLLHCIRDGWVYSQNFGEKLFHVGNPLPSEINNTAIELTSSCCIKCYAAIRRAGNRARREVF